MADVVAVEQVRVAPLRGERALDVVGDRRFSGARETREPEHDRPLALQLGASYPVDVERLPVHVRGATQAEVDHLGGDSVALVIAVDENEAAGVEVLP